MPAEHTYWKIPRGKMELPEMIRLPALCISPVKGRVIGFWVGARADVREHFKAALRSSGIMG